MLTLTIILATLLCLAAIIIYHSEYQKYSLLKAKKEKRRIKRDHIYKDLIPYFIHQIELANSLNEIFILHIKLWANDIRHTSFGPNEFGMFRTKDILLMNKEEVFLGNIWGLHTKPLTFWETCKDPDSVAMVIRQYKNQLISNLKAMQDEENNSRITLK